MSILIKGMEIPEECEDCPFFFFNEELDSCPACFLTKFLILRKWDDDMAMFCPLVEVKRPKEKRGYLNPSELDEMTLKTEAEALGYVAIKKSEFEAYENAYVLQQIRSKR